jgi:hypothetical protein
MAATDERIVRLQEKLRQLKAQQAMTEARRRVLDARRERKADTRRKILVGAIVLAKVEQGVIDKAQLWGCLDAGLIRPDDRHLFGL